MTIFHLKKVPPYIHNQKMKNKQIKIHYQAQINGKKKQRRKEKSSPFQGAAFPNIQTVVFSAIKQSQPINQLRDTIRTGELFSTPAPQMRRWPPAADSEDRSDLTDQGDVLKG